MSRRWVAVLVLGSSLAAAGAALGQPPPLPFYQQVAWSPDGERLAFCAVIESWETGYEMFLIDVDGGGLERLGPGMYPRFSPDGRRIAFSRDGDLFLMASDGSAVERLTGGAARDSYPTWSPDGERLAFMSRRREDYDIYTMRADGGDERRLTDDPADDYNPAWSADGERLVFERHPEGEPTTLWSMRHDGGDQRSLGVSCSFPDVSPDGSWIACGGADATHGGHSIYLVAPEGSAKRLLTRFAFLATWSPDGTLLALATAEEESTTGRVNGIALVDRDGSELRHLLRGASGSPSDR